MTLDVTRHFETLGVVPVIVIEDPAQALALGRALLEGGLPCAEITFRTGAAEKVIRTLSDTCPDLLVGAGTVLSVDQVEKARRAGARFIVAPGFSPRVVDHCLGEGVPVYPGICTPTEIEGVLERGLTVVKFFPAEAAGGLKFLKAISAPYAMMRFIPTGGISPANLKDYLNFERVLACGGTWLARDELLQEGRFAEIRESVRQAVAAVAEARASQLPTRSEQPL